LWSSWHLLSWRLDIVVVICKYRGMKEPEDLGSGYLPALSSFWDMKIMVGKLKKSIMEKGP
jgi:hypothetical protein